jgi:hypothetical protein
MKVKLAITSETNLPKPLPTVAEINVQTGYVEDALRAIVEDLGDGNLFESARVMQVGPGAYVVGASGGLHYIIALVRVVG